MSTPPPAGLPDDRVCLLDGEEIRLRAVVPDDEGVLLELLEHVTGESRTLRFFTAAADLAGAARLEARTDGVRAFGLLAESAEDGRVLGHGMCVPVDERTGEVAFEVADGHHRRGIGGVLLAGLVGRARDAGYEALVADVLSVNRDMHDMLAASGLEMTSRRRDGVDHVLIPLPR